MIYFAGTERISALSLSKSSISERSGRNLGRKNHYKNPPIEQVQEEVLMNEGYFRQTDNPIPVLDNNGNQIFDADDKTPWYYVDFVELVKPIR